MVQGGRLISEEATSPSHPTKVACYLQTPSLSSTTLEPLKEARKTSSNNNPKPMEEREQKTQKE